MDICRIILLAKMPRKYRPIFLDFFLYILSILSKLVTYMTISLYPWSGP